MSRITQRPRQIDLNRPIIKYDNFEEFSKLDTTYEIAEPIVIEKNTVNHDNASSSANKKKDGSTLLKEKKGKADITTLIQKQDILIPEAKKLEELKK